MKARQPFCWWMTSTKVSNLFLPSLPKWLKWPLDVCGGVGYGRFYWFSLYWKNFSQTSLELEIFPDIQRCKIFSALYVMSDIFFSAGYFSPSVRAFFLSKSVCRTIFLKSPLTPSKVKWSAPKIHQTFGQLTDSDLSTISKGFWNNRGQNVLGERGGICFYLPLPEKSVRTYGRTYSDVITKFSRMDSLPNFITQGTPLRALRARRLRYYY